MNMKHKILTGEETFSCDNTNLGKTIKDFWAWSMSRLMADGPRGDLAEFIVNTALGVDTSIPKKGWGECDIVYNNIRIEIKCSAYLQAWERSSHSKPAFSIAKTINCDISEFEGGYRYIGRDSSPPQRHSDLYIFCLFAATERDLANPMKLDQWEFYIAPTKLIDKKLGDQRKISLQGIERLGISKCGYNDIKAIVDTLDI